MQVCISLQTDNHASTPPLSFLQTGCPSCCPTNSIKALKAKIPLLTYAILHTCGKLRRPSSGGSAGGSEVGPHQTADCSRSQASGKRGPSTRVCPACPPPSVSTLYLHSPTTTQELRSHAICCNCSLCTTTLLVAGRSVRGLRFKSHHGRLCISRQSLRYTALCTATTRFFTGRMRFLRPNQQHQQQQQQQ